jgi:hypothetical protein
MTELLETTLALDPDLVEFDRRLSDRAFARIVKGVKSNLATEVKAQLKKGVYQLSTVPGFESEEADHEGARRRPRL